MTETINQPDEAEQKLAEALDNVVPSYGYALVPIVGIGGSAGGIDALRLLLGALPESSGVAFVIVMHLAPDRENGLVPLLQSFTRLPVVQAGVSDPVMADHIYVIPRGKSLRTYDGRLQTADLPERRHRHVAVDLFFRALADTHGAHAAAVVLSGMDGDGAIGLKRIKERGGLTIAQDPLQAAQPGMPRASIATGMVDWVLPAEEIPGRLQRYFAAERLLRLPAENLLAEPSELNVQNGADEAVFADILSFLQLRTGRDVSCYKRSTILRRMARRMQVNAVLDLASYLDCLRTMPGEAGAFLIDLLISVTNFFRDGDCFAALDPVLKTLLESKPAGSTFRVWTAGCATGEEAYTLAILLSEHARSIPAAPRIQIFATDLDEEAIAVAREAFYPAASKADLPEHLLARYFLAENDGYRVRRDIREMVLFAVHDLLNDSPFSRLDLVTCRNLLIYLKREAQTRVLATFAFSLFQDGVLFLGAAEAVDDENPSFDVIDKKSRIFRRRAGHRAGARLSGADGFAPGGFNGPALLRPPPVVADAALQRTGTLPAVSSLAVRPAGWGEWHLQLLEQYGPPSVLLDAHYNMVHLSENAGGFLRLPMGEPTANILEFFARPVRDELQVALHQASWSGTVVRISAAADAARPDTAFSIRVVPIKRPASCFLLFFDRQAPGTDAAASEVRDTVLLDPAALNYTAEFEGLKTQLRDTVRAYETSNEEFKANNEELQAMNEELRSATEELETGREELQSINEELSTVNQELKTKVDELAQANTDMLNLMNATAIATVFLDRDLRITRFTPPAVALFNFIASDHGRPLSDLSTVLDDQSLVEDAARVIETLQPVEREISRRGRDWFLVRLLPYRTMDHRIAGVVLTFVDVTERKLEQEALRISQEKYSVIVNEASAGVVQVRLDGSVAFANPSYQRMLGYSEAELTGMRLQDLVHPDDLARALELFGRLARTGESFQIEKRCICKDGAIIWTSNSVSRLAGAVDQDDTALAMCTDITLQKQAQEALRTSEERLRLIIENAVEFAIFSTGPDMRITRWSSGAERLMGYTEAEMLGRHFETIFTAEDRAAGRPEAEREQALLHGRAVDDKLHVRKDASTFWASGALMPMRAAGAVVGFVKILRDQTQERQAQSELVEGRARLIEALAAKAQAHAALEAADVAKNRFLAVLSHELRNPLASIHSATQALSSGALGPEDTGRAIDILNRQCGAMKKLMDDLLDITRLSLGRLVLQRETVLLSTVLQHAIEASRPVIDGFGHHFEFAIPEQPVELVADTVRLSQVFTNLLVNAAKYTPPGGHIALEAVVDQGTLEVRVRDDGAGMAPENVAAMFEMFVQHSSHVASGAGLGIGLALVRNIMELHGGTVEGRSEGPGRGSVFTVRLPLAHPRPARDPNQADRKTVERMECKVLVADDNADMTWGVAALLRKSGCRVSTASGGEEALAKAKNDFPDVAVLDLGMPDLSGQEVAQRLRGMQGDRPLLLIAATGWGQQADRDSTDAAGFDAHLTKPVDLQSLQVLIQEHLKSQAAAVSASRR